MKKDTDLLGSLTEDPGYLQFLHPNIRDSFIEETSTESSTNCSTSRERTSRRSNSASSREASPVQGDWALPDLV